MKKLIIACSIFLLVGLGEAQNPDSVWLSLDPSGYPVLTELELDIGDTVEFNFILRNASDAAHALSFPLCYDHNLLELQELKFDSTTFPGSEYGLWNFFTRDTIMNDSGKVMLYAWTGVYTFGVPQGVHRIGTAKFTAIASGNFVIDTCWYPPAGHLSYTNAPNAIDYYPEWQPVEVQIGSILEPDIEVQPDVVQFFATEEGNLLTNNMLVRNIGDPVLIIDSIVSQAIWVVTIRPNSFVAPDVNSPQQWQNVHIRVTPQGLLNGVYYDTLLIYSNDPDEPVYPEPIEFTVNLRAPEIGIFPESLYFYVATESVLTKRLDIKNLESFPVVIDSITKVASWIDSINPTFFELEGGEKEPVYVTINSAELGGGIYRDTLKFYVPGPFDDTVYNKLVVLEIGGVQNPDSAWLSLDPIGYPVLTELELDIGDTVELNFILLNASDMAHALMFPLYYDHHLIELQELKIDTTAFPMPVVWSFFENDTVMNDSGKVMLYAWTAVYDFGVPTGVHRVGTAKFTAIASGNFVIDTCWYPPQGRLFYTNGPNATDYYPEWQLVNVSISGYSPDVAEGSSGIPETFIINVPTISKGRTDITFALPTATKLDIVVYDALGRLLGTLVSKRFSAGIHSISVRLDFPLGVYFLKLVAAGSLGEGDEFSDTKKILLLR